MIKLVKVLFIFGILGGGLLVFGYQQYKTTIVIENSENTQTVDYTIEIGESLESITSDLIENNLLSESNRWAFDLYLKETGLASTIQAGVFRIPQNLTIVELVDTLQEAGIPDLWVSVPEGVRRDEISSAIAAEFAKYPNTVFDEIEFLALTQDKEFMARWELGDLEHLEGYLYADKYKMPVEATAEYVLITLVDTFFQRAPDDFTYEELIVASMIEREARTPKDRALVSDVIWKRYNEGWFLGIDATILYQYKDWSRELTFQDLEADHSYNTRNRVGLPPTPICNPSQSSLDSARTPESNTYYYYISDLDGVMHYSEDLQGHEENIANYLQ